MKVRATSKIITWKGIIIPGEIVKVNPIDGERWIQAGTAVKVK